MDIRRVLPPASYWRFRNLTFELHWLLGVTLGTILMVVGVTGGLLSFEDDILRLLNPGVLRVDVRDDTPLLTPSEIVERVSASGRTVTAVTVTTDPAAPVRVMLAPQPAGGVQAGGPGAGPGPVPGLAGPGGPRGEMRLVDPYTAAPLGQPVGQSFMRDMRELHRWLLNRELGRPVVGAATLALLVLAVSGIYLRWPRKPLSWRAWLALDLRRRGNALWWELHRVLGVWMLVPYLVMALTGLTWSFEWYRNGLYDLVGVPVPSAGGPSSAGGERGGGGQGGGARTMERSQAAAPSAGQGAGGQGDTAIDLGKAWMAFRIQVGDWQTATIRPPVRRGQPLTVQYRTNEAPHERANNTLTLDPVTYAVKEHKLYADQPWGQKLVSSIFPLHSGDYFGMAGRIVFMVSSLAMLMFWLTGWVLYLARRRRKARAAGLAIAAVQK